MLLSLRISFADQVLVVADSGPGIAPELEERLYEAGAKGRASAGVGLQITSTAESGTRAELQFAGQHGG